MNAKQKTIRCYCDSCQQETNHIELARERQHSTDNEYWWMCDYCIVKCCGCDNISLLTATEEEAIIQVDDHGNAMFPTIYKTYPNHKPFADKLDNIWPIPSNISTIYCEIIEALNNDCFLLAAAGFRVIVEAICIDNGIEGKTLESKINNLFKKGIITKNDRDRLHSIRFMGNDSVHYIKTPTKQQLKLVLDVIHNMLNGLYVLTDKCNKILESPISTFQEFLQLLDEGLKKRSVGEIDILKNLLPPSRRLISEDRSTFESQLKEQILKGEYIKLSLCPTPTTGRNQQYKILSI